MVREELIDLAVMGIGAGAKGTVTGYLSGVLPGVSEDILAIVAGGALYYFGGRLHPLVSKFGAGVLIAGIGQLTKGIIGGGGSHSPKGSHSPRPQEADALKAIARIEAARPVRY